ncbi:ribonuclease H2 subunit B-like isoform X1 [Centruroides sculpturatus]|uniref:ribonuclease H2 subunit B-like isoform X1 n=1 Tax=Centruroides sculpturatus TaxID=218467 RepID=UPI000C6D70BD|nr:ribonuclease H2 subunit B-like isoform X1 [Centruroides sculpturatus]
MAQKVFIIPKNLIDNEEESENTYRITTLKCLKTGNPVKYIFDEKKYQLHEILQFQNPKNSWFIDDSVEQDGVIYVTTTVDPLFLILPYLKEVYSPLDQLFVDENFPDCKILSQCCLSRIDLITDKKEFGDESLYKYSEVKTIQWLKLKFENLVFLLKEKEIECSNGSKVAGLILKNKSQQIERIRKCAYEIICQYLDDKYCRKLSEALKLTFKNPAIDNPVPSDFRHGFQSTFSNLPHWRISFLEASK